MSAIYRRDPDTIFICTVGGAVLGAGVSHSSWGAIIGAVLGLVIGIHDTTWRLR